MRLFFALWPDSSVQRTLAEWARACQGACAGRQQQADRLHVTLAFLGEVDLGRYQTLCDIADSIRANVFALTLDRVGYWRHNRIVYATTSDRPEALAALAAGLSTRLAAAGFRSEARAFVPHVTLIRDARRAPDNLDFAPLPWSVSTLTLVETTREDGKLAYRRLQSWTLCG